MENFTPFDSGLFELSQSLNMLLDESFGGAGSAWLYILHAWFLGLKTW